MGAILSSWGRSFAEPTEGTGRTEIKSTSAGNKATEMSLCQQQLGNGRIKQERCVQGLLFCFSHCLLLALKAFSSIVPLLVELLRSGFGAMSPERGRVEFLNSWD